MKLRYKLLIGIILLGITGFLVIHFFIPKTPPSISLPGGPTINMDTKSFDQGVKQMLKKQDDLGKRVNNLESTIRQQQTELVEKQIPEAAKETDIEKSFDRMLAHW